MHTTTSMEGVTRLLQRVWRRGDRAAPVATDLGTAALPDVEVAPLQQRRSAEAFRLPAEGGKVDIVVGVFDGEDRLSRLDEVARFARKNSDRSNPRSRRNRRRQHRAARAPGRSSGRWRARADAPRARGSADSGSRAARVIGKPEFGLVDVDVVRIDAVENLSPCRGRAGRASARRARRCRGCRASARPASRHRACR